MDKHNNDDPLLSCLGIICRLDGISFSAPDAISGLPLVNDCLTPSLFVRAARKLNINSKVAYRTLNKIAPAVLPAVLILKGNKACVLLKRKAENAVVIFPDNPTHEQKISIEALEKQYAGYVILTHSFQDYDERAKQYQKIMKGSWFWQTVWRFRSVYLNVILAAFLVNIFTLATPLFIMNVYDRVVPTFAVSTLWVLVTGILVLFTFDLILRTLRNYLIDAVGQKVDVLLASDLFSHVLGMKLSGKPQSAGAFANNLREFDTLREFFTSATLTSIVDVPFLLLFIGIVSYIGGHIAWIPLTAAPIVVIATYLFEKPMRRAVESVKVGAAQKHAILTEAIHNLETIKILSAEGVMQRKWEHFVNLVSKVAVKTRFFSSLAANFTMYMQQIVTVALVVVGVYMIQAGTLTVGGLIACIILSGRALAPLGQITNIITRFEMSRLALSNLNHVMAEPLERSKKDKFLHREKMKGDIEFYDVSFRYPNQSLPAVSHVSFKVNAGERVGIIGKVGAGKSTLARLAMSLYAADDGTISIDGTNVAQLDPADLRYNVGFCSQDSRLFYGSVRDNILLGKHGVSDDEMIKFAKIAGVDHFISKHPSGYDFEIGEAGEGLSGGQQQSINLTRTLLLNSPVLILDEPTSSMDNTSEAEIIKGLAGFLKNQTLIIATHRLSLLSLVNRLIVLDEGKVIMDGPRDEVLSSLSRK